MEILYQDDDLVAINKPTGLMVHRSPLEPSATDFALQQTRNRIHRRVYPVHRLDRPVSGLLLFALTPEVAKAMIQAFAKREISKTYLAIVRGYTESEGIIDHPLRIKGTSSIQPKEAITHYSRLATAELPHPVGRYNTARYSLITVRPKTGRTHQIRRHLKHIAHPILGDTEYGDRHHNRFLRQHLECDRILLAATKLEFDHPRTRNKLTLTAPLDKSFLSVISQFNWCQYIPKTPPCQPQDR